MKYSSLLLFFLFFNIGCQSQPATPNDASLKDLRWNLNNAQSMQLPSSLPDSLNGKVYLKSFSVNYRMADSIYVLEIPELRRTVEKDSTFGGSKYYLPLSDIEVKNVRIVLSPDQRHTAILIPAKPGKTFLHSPYGNEPERRVAAVTIGWYERVQDKTLARCLTHWQQFLAKLSE